MKIVMFGVGGVGGYFGGRLAECGADITFVARGRHLAAMQASGLKVNSYLGDFVIPNVSVTNDVTTITDPVDVILIATKTWQLADAIVQMQPLVSANTMVVPMLNGVSAPAQLQAAFGEAPVIGGYCGILSHLKSPGVIEHAGTEPFVVFGELDNTQSERVLALLATFEACQHINPTVPPDILAAMWRKHLLVSSLGAVGAASGANFGTMLGTPELRALLRDVMHEVVDVAQGMEINLPRETVEKTLTFLDTLPSSSITSMQRDILNQKPSELDGQVGATVKFGESCGVPTPHSRALYWSLWPLEQKHRSRQ